MHRLGWIALLIGGTVLVLLLLPHPEVPARDTRSLCETNWTAYEQMLLQARQTKDSLFRVSERSPIPPEEKSTFTGLGYYPPDSVWRLKGNYQALPQAVPPVIGIITLSLPALDSCRLPARLLVYGGKEGETYIAFWDSTAAYRETYEGGRYVPVHISDTQACVDFNRAYFPYCAYNPNYICLPYPPQNRLCLPIPAGEKWKAASIAH